MRKKLQISPLIVQKKRGKKSRSPNNKKKSPIKFPKNVNSKKRKKRTYCGNNAVARELRLGQSVMGTRYTCLRKGFGTGYYEPPNPNFLDEYVPIDDTVIYCGNKEILPPGYDRFGSLSDCMRKGYGAGKRKRASEN